MKVRVTGHFGEWIQGRIGPSGTIGLVTVACPALFVDAERQDDGPLAIDDPVGLIDKAPLSEFLNQVGGVSGTYRLESNMVPGGGAGASTAALIALARAAGAEETGLIDACLATEGATDPLMLEAPDRALWASRDGRSLASLQPLPEAEIIGGYFGNPLVTNPVDRFFPDVSDLAKRLERAVPLAELASIATESARRSTSLRGPIGDPTDALASALGALGHLRAHTGSARGLVFAPGTAPSDYEAILTEAGFSNPIRFRTGGSP